MRRLVVLFAGTALALAACAGPDVRSPAPASVVTPAAVSPLASPPPCPGRTWPPYALGVVPGIAAVSTDIASVEITNDAGRTVYYRVSGWTPARFEGCWGPGEVEVQRGPLAAGATERVAIDPEWSRAGVAVTVAIWEEPCGEACAREPAGAMVVALSRLVPPAS